MGRTYGRTMYWIYIDGILTRIRLMPGAVVENNIAYPTFPLDNHKGVYTIDARGMAKTKKIAIERQEEMQKYAIRNL